MFSSKLHGMLSSNYSATCVAYFFLNSYWFFEIICFVKKMYSLLYIGRIGSIIFEKNGRIEIGL